MRAGSKEIVAAMVMLSVSFTAALSPQDYRIIEGGSPMVPKGCHDRCGNLTIFYPFGMGPNKACYVNKWFLINCTQSSSGGVQKPYLSSFSPSKGVREILDISLSQQTITVQESISPFSCGPAEAADETLYFNHTKLYGTPYSYGSPDYYMNIFVVLGCGNALMATLPENITQGGCTSLCGDHASTHLHAGCYGINCCQFTPYSSTASNNVKGYQGMFTKQAAVANASCNYVFLVEGQYWIDNSHNIKSSSGGLPGSRLEELVVPVAWSWDFPFQNFPPSSSSHTCNTLHNMGSCDCNYPSRGNPYLVNGCQGRRHKLTVKEQSAIIGVSASFGFLMLLSASYILYKALRKRQMKKQRQTFFKRNGGLLLEQQLLAKEGTIEKSKIFTAIELEKATDHFNANRILGRGGQGTVYKGMLVDGQIVAIKKSQAVDEDQLEPFINEVVILSQINHRNVVKLLGCCLETEVPILVYEYIHNGTLFSLIHDNFGDDEQIPLSWDIRLRIASEVANALAYLHFATSIPIYHRDIKSSNILLDDKFRAKVSDFGTSRSISIDQTHLTTIVKGTFGYLDPEYFQSSQFTDKSDVYSFGVVLAELLTGQKPISFLVDIGEDRSLVTRFLLCMEENRLLNILDIQVLEQGRMDDIMAVSLLAKRCLNINGKIRPTMKEVVVELEAIRASHSHYLLYMESDVVA